MRAKVFPQNLNTEDFFQFGQSLQKVNRLWYVSLRFVASFIIRKKSVT